MFNTNKHTPNPVMPDSSISREVRPSNTYPALNSSLKTCLSTTRPYSELESND